MDVHKTSLLTVFDAKQRLEVPLFQRQYVWTEDRHWTPLWEDIARKFTEALEGRKDAPHHFLGAMVLDQVHTPTGHVVVRQVIDGQQRLTTLQIFIAAYRDFCRFVGCAELADECGKFLLNTGMMSNADVDRFKVWPTQLDRKQFADVVGAGSYEELVRVYPLVRRKYARKPEPRPRMVEAYLFFFQQLRLFFVGAENESPLAAEVAIGTRLDECFQTLRSALMVVVIDLQRGDDPQVIFETLNARGEPLLPADLLRNYIFFRANRDGLDTERVYATYWSKFDDEFWREEVKQGRLSRPRSDLFMQHFLASRQAQDIPIKHLYVEYRHWLETQKPFANVTDELAALARQRDHFRRIISPEPDDVVFGISTFLEAFDIRTAYPLLLALFEKGLGDSDWPEVSQVLESFLLRRAVCGLTTANYNRIFLNLTRSVVGDGYSVEKLTRVLRSLTGDSGIWPDDAAFREAWLTEPLYETMTNPRLCHILARINQTFMSSKAERLHLGGPLTIEHVMPRSWTKNWPLSDGSKGIDVVESLELPDDDVRVVASRQRDQALDRIGNLTLLTSSLNTAQSNLGWKQKRPELMKHSLLPINQMLATSDRWDEAAISERANDLFSRALKIWPM
jgi:uncharacterized protein with ParB-like and HNH nuclease domain